MEYDALFDTAENKALIAICTRRMISLIGLGGIMLGIIAIVLGILTLHIWFLNIGLIILGLAMLATGIYAFRKPSLDVLLAATVVAALIFIWGLAVALYLSWQREREYTEIPIILLITAYGFAGYYRKLGHVREHIESVQPEQIETAMRLCKELRKKDLKKNPHIIQTRDKTCRAELLDNSAFFMHRNLMRAFLASREDVCGAVRKPGSKRIEIRFRHPVGRLRYKFDRTNTAKLARWLAG